MVMKLKRKRQRKGERTMNKRFRKVVEWKFNTNDCELIKGIIFTAFLIAIFQFIAGDNFWQPLFLGLIEIPILFFGITKRNVYWIESKGAKEK